MSEQSPKSFEAEARDTVIKSSITGVAATFLAVTVFTPAGLGGMVGTSLASGFGFSPSGDGENVYANLPAYPAPLSPQELNEIRGQLARVDVSLEITRAATNEKIERIRALSLADATQAFSPAPIQVAAPVADLRFTVDEPRQSEAAAPAAVTTTIESVDPLRDRHLELAELMLAHENL